MTSDNGFTLAPGSLHGAFMAFTQDDGTYASLRDFAIQAGFPAAVVQPGGIDVLTDVVGNAAMLPKIILIDVDGVADPLPAMVRLIEALEGVTQLIAVGTANDARLFRALLSAGAADYLVKPINPDMMRTAYDSAAMKIKGTEDGEAQSRVIPIIGARGGVGATTIAVNLGWLLAHQHAVTTALFDLDLHYGTSTLALDLVPGRGLKEALQMPGRLDSVLIASSMASESDRFSILGAEEPVEEIVSFDGSATVAVTAELKNNFQYILVDLPRHLLAQQKRLLAESDTIIVVAEQTLASVRDVVRLKAALKTLAPQARLLLVVGRAGTKADRTGQLDRSSFEKGVQDTVAVYVPEDSQPVSQAANNGRALGHAAPQAPVTQALVLLAAQVVGVPAPAAKSGGWFGFKSKPKNKGK